jgi:low affinity Fe/Cu permease
MREWFRRFAYATSEASGSVWAFLAALAMVVAWAAMGPFMGYSEMWQLTINTTTTIITFLMVFLIQSTQNRDAKSMELKLDELIRAVKGARTRLVRLEELSDDEIEGLRKEFDALHKRLARTHDANRLPGGPHRATE